MNGFDEIALLVGGEAAAQEFLAQTGEEQRGLREKPQEIVYALGGALSLNFLSVYLEDRLQELQATP